MLRKYIGDLYLTTRWYLLMGSCALFFVLAYFFEQLYVPAIIYTLGMVLITLADYILLFFLKGTVKATRIMAPRFSLGDENKVTLSLSNTYPYKITAGCIDELPEQFQLRDFYRSVTINYLERIAIDYTLRPLTRGEYAFGRLLCYVKTPLALLQRRIVAAEPATVKVYPSYMQLKKYQLLAVSDNHNFGIRKIRRMGHSLEFEKIKDYVQGDDMRTINWKATARRDTLMVNTYTDARQQQIYSIIDKGRSMKMPFEGMTLLDYAINATLALLNIALMKQDRAGLISFASKVHDIIPADRRSGQLNHLLEALYKQQTDFKESDYEHLWSTIHRRINQRSFLLLFTNFETMASLERQLPFLKRLAGRHLVCVVFFENTLLKTIHENQPDSIEGIYIKTIADRFDFEKKQIVKELRRHGVLSILTTPQQLTADVINKYLELKARQMI
jgi:uncharacterized protein (DUF58 family)